MHAAGHSEDCQYTHSLGFTDGVGRSDGEGVERPWAELNQLGGSTREMTYGHHQEVIEDHLHFWNFVKSSQMCTYLWQKHREASKQAEHHREDFQGLCAITHPALLKKWENMSPLPRKEGTTVQSVYKLPNGLIPTRKQMYDRLRLVEAAEEPVWSEASAPTWSVFRGRPSAATFINMGLCLEDEQHKVTSRASAVLRKDAASIDLGLHRARDALAGHLN
ncbi:hypothetical protein DACRYDRAFT_112705 [Dacryopinax primogenitus]|uniref:Uncharacterized protein n=1 Tax=Dacryopinax primogenitus (strain DJM 731) TaxID=1858805 RepID=M5FPL2_DACPD|nr:uncharacterized protein DACRYDRAFT_112705 [Dacryopinax primogenitus]EJT96499.1 hypothetical protein DACRYDRAFT_112705 [Dacryopinax primogenitus]